MGFAVGDAAAHGSADAGSIGGIDEVHIEADGDAGGVVHGVLEGVGHDFAHAALVNVAHGEDVDAGFRDDFAFLGVEIVKKSGVHVFTMRDIDERGMREVMADALKYAMDDTAGIAVSLDMDFVDPADAPGVGTPVRGGVTYREAHLAMEMIADTESMVSLEVVEINPILDEHNRTALLGVELVLSGLGQKIL